MFPSPFPLCSIFGAWYTVDTMVFSLFTSPDDSTLVLLVDVGSGSVGGSLVRIQEGRPPHILTTVRRDIEFQSTLSSARFLLTMNNALEQTLKDIQRVAKGHGSPAHIFCTLSSPWFILKTRHLRIVRGEPFEISERTIGAFLDEEIVRLKEELALTIPPKEVEVIEKKIIQMKLNGYELKNPYGQRTASMEMVVAIGVSSTRVVSSVKRKIGQIFHTKSLSFDSFPLVAFSALRDIFPNERNFLFLDITGEATDVSLVERDVLLANTLFTRGKNFFIREISAGLHTVHEEAESLFGMYMRRELPDNKKEIVGDVVHQSRIEWLQRFEKALETLAGEGTLPRTVFFLADPDVAEFFADMIKGAQSKFLLNNGFEPRFLDTLITKQFVSFENSVIRDPFLVVLALLTYKELFTRNE